MTVMIPDQCSKLGIMLFGFVVFCVAQDPSPADRLPLQPDVVKGLPFTAEAVTETTLVLADGNRIVTQVTALIARDFEGRTRRETQVGERSVVFILDPV